MNILLIYVVIFALFFWFMNKSNKKRQQAERDKEASLRPGMYVMLRDGFYGTVVDTDERDIVVNLSIDGSDAGCVVITRAGVDRIVEEGEIPMSAGREGVEESVTVTEYKAQPTGDETLAATNEETHAGEDEPDSAQDTSEDAAAAADTKDGEA